MADRIFQGKLVAETSPAFPESSESFDKPHAGGLVPFELLKHILAAGRVETKIVGGALWVSDGDAWFRVQRDGTIEIGISAG